MSTPEDHATARARAAMQSIAATIHDAPPLRLTLPGAPAPAADDPTFPSDIPRWSDTPGTPGLDAPDSGAVGSGGGNSGRSGRRAARRPGGTDRPSGRGRDRNWRSWLAPVTAAAAVVAVAVSLTVVKNLPASQNSAVSATALGGSTNASTTGVDGTPRYYAQINDISETSKTPPAGTGLVIVDSVTGKAVATIPRPADTLFLSVSAAANDQTFVVYAETSATDSFGFGAPGQRSNNSSPLTVTAAWYEVRLAPGTAHPASLSRLPIEPWSWKLSMDASESPGEVESMALSASGQELAVLDETPKGWQEVKVFSVATGKLLHDWSTNNRYSAAYPQVSSLMFTSIDPADAWNVPAPTSALTWIDGDRAIALAATGPASVKPGNIQNAGIVRRLNVAGPVSGNLLTDSTVIWSADCDLADACFSGEVSGTLPLIVTNGNTADYVEFDDQDDVFYQPMTGAQVSTTHSPAVPDVSGETAQQAIDTLRQAGFTNVTTDILAAPTNEKVAPGVIYQQNQTAGTDETASPSIEIFVQPSTTPTASPGATSGATSPTDGATATATAGTTPTDSTAPAAPALSASMSFPTEKQIGGQITAVEWGSPSGNKLIVEISSGSSSNPIVSFGMIANGKFTPLHSPANLQSNLQSTLSPVAF